ncbi:MAG TPA: MFS transporter [Thermomicrobiaceae bacterium]|nr:MFS transporter [Thermomicrobiaceae bacterium]
MRLPWVLQHPTLRLVLALVAFAGLAVGLTIPFLTLTARDRGVSLTAIGVMASSYLVAQMLLQLPMGSLSDRLGRAAPLAAGLVVEGLATASFARAGSPASFIALRTLQGVGVAMLFPAVRALVADVTPEDRRGQAYAGFGAAFSSGMLFGPLVGGSVAGALGVGPLFVAAGVVEVLIGIWALTALRGAGRPGRAPHPSERVSFAELLVKPLIGAFVLSFASQFLMGMFSGVWSIYLADLGASDFKIGLSFSTFSIAYLAMAPMGGRLADSGARWRRLLWANLALGAVIAGYGLIPVVWVILVLGLFEGAISTVAQPSLDAYLATVADPRVMGRVQGAYATVGMAGAAISALLGPVLYGGSRVLPFVAGGIILWLLALVAIPLIRQTERERAARLPVVAAERARAAVLVGAEPER